MAEIKPGDKVKVRASVLAILNKQDREFYTGRVGVVETVWRRGDNTSVAVDWPIDAGGGLLEAWHISELERVDA